nr:DUF429 domain-containing protein [Patulibacter sp. SYSU D01012]
MAVGADGARRGWMAALAHGTGGDVDRVELRLAPNVDALLALGAPDAPVAVDMPIGLLDAVAFRPCDLAARERLGARRATIFAPPSRPLLDAEDYRAAQDRVAATRAAGTPAQGLSAQAFGLVRKIRELDARLQADPAAQERTWECHPELSFAQLAGGPPLPDKRSIGGLAARLALLGARFPGVLDALRAVDAGSRAADPTDALDALAALHTALRVRAGAHVTLGDGAADAAGLPMRIVV